MKVYALDIGGSAVKQALVDVAGPRALITEAFAPIRLSTNIFKDLRELVLEATNSVLRKHADLDTIAISTTGSVDESGRVRRAGHFEGYENVSWEAILRGKFSSISHVAVVNDGKAATWAEFSADCEPRSTTRMSALAHVVVGTGIGGGIVVNGALLYGNDGSAGCFGHIKVCADEDIPCSCKRVGCVETVASAPAIVRSFQRRSGQQRAGSCDLDEVVQMAIAGDRVAIEVFEAAGRWLGIALSNVINILNPRVVTIGGGVVLAANAISSGHGRNIFVDAAAKSAMSLVLPRLVDTSHIQAGTSGNDGGLLGAALLASEA